MRRTSRRLLAVAFGCALVGIAVGEAQSRKINSLMVMDDHHFMGMAAVPDFQLVDPPVGETTAPKDADAGSRGSTLIAHGKAFFVVDRDSGTLTRTNGRGVVKASVKLGGTPGQIALDAGKERLYVADRSHDRVVVYDVSQGLSRVGGTRVIEPHGLALSPDGATLLVTSVAEREVVALNASTLDVRWTRRVGPEPRGVAIAPDGRQALVSSLNSGTVARIDLDDAAPVVEFVSLDTAGPVGNAGQRAQLNQSAIQQAAMPVQTKGGAVPSGGKDAGRGFARNAHEVGYIGHGIGVVAHQVSIPQAQMEGFENTGVYGGGVAGMPPIVHQIAFLERGETHAPSRVARARTSLHQPRAMHYDGAEDTLYVVGYGDDRLIAIADASQPSAHLAWTTGLKQDGNAKGCGPDGVTMTEQGRLAVHCELSRTLTFVDAPDEPRPGQVSTAKVRTGPELASSQHSASRQRGAEIFRRGRDARLSTAGAMACASCHPEGRTDGLSWRIESRALQTPLLAGRVTGTHPYKWDGKDKDLPTSLKNTIGRLGGGGLQPTEVADLRNFLESLEAPRSPERTKVSVARGLEAFEDAGCDACHSGKKLADGDLHDVGSELAKVDTPSLVGLAHTAPYYHDGSARTLRALLLDNGSFHGMSGVDSIDEDQVDDLIAYLETL